MASDKNVSVHVHTRRPLTFCAGADGQTVWFTCPEFVINVETDRRDEAELAVFLGSIEEAKRLADAIHEHCWKQAAAYQKKAEAMATAGGEAPDG